MASSRRGGGERRVRAAPPHNKEQTASSKAEWPRQQTLPKPPTAYRNMSRSAGRMSCDVAAASSDV